MLAPRLKHRWSTLLYWAFTAIQKKGEEDHWSRFSFPGQSANALHAPSCKRYSRDGRRGGYYWQQRGEDRSRPRAHVFPHVDVCVCVIRFFARRTSGTGTSRGRPCPCARLSQTMERLLLRQSQRLKPFTVSIV
ncbi:hypothetical protein BDA96_06G067900 [Sorghum bicolor]|jgi:hypothetical protein|uniref:Uncharacterized protein n=1 Tax=Sorghum bicolor TaxID=4558 RepID=A0A921QPN2_SORBI|nr:hypothetical protein BDA96_06G067900 [Sorghum bicolor]